MEATKVCTRCGIMKLLTDYSVSKRSSTGRQSTCKCCDAERRRQRRDKDREAARRWRENNIERHRDTHRKYRAAHREDYARYARINQKKDRENLGPVYVADVLGLKREDVPPELMALKREQIALRRLVRELGKELTNQKEK